MLSSDLKRILIKHHLFAIVWTIQAIALLIQKVSIENNVQFLLIVLFLLKLWYYNHVMDAKMSDSKFTIFHDKFQLQIVHKYCCFCCCFCCTFGAFGKSLEPWKSWYETTKANTLNWKLNKALTYTTHILSACAYAYKYVLG